MTKNFLTALCAVALTAVAAGAEAALVTFELAYSGASLGNSAEAHGTVTVDDAYFPSQTSGLMFLYPGIEISDFSITVSGASVGNGTFHLPDYGSFSWDTAGANLNLSAELVGQTPPAGGWGSTHEGSTGEFNFFTDSSIAPAAPTGLNTPFQIVTDNGNGDALYLTSFRPAVVPLPATVWLMASALGALAGGRIRTKP